MDKALARGRLGACSGRSSSNTIAARTRRTAAACVTPRPAAHSHHSSSSNSSRCRTTRCAALGEGGSGGDDLTAVFAAEVARRQAAEAAAAEAEAASSFDGQALLRLIQNKYQRSYDVSLVQRQYMGKTFVALNVMWRYREQASWGYTEEQFSQRLDYVAAAIVAWGAVGTVQCGLATTKERPRVGKAVSIFLDVPPERAAEWIAS